MDELDAMKTIRDTLSKLPEEAVGRVLRWACEIYAIPADQQRTVAPRSNTFSSMAEPEKAATSFESAAELLASAETETEADRVLAVSYWFQVLQGAPDIEAQAISTELKHLGHGVSNITRAFDSLISARPQLVIQLRKSGASRQARKKYKVTNEGVQRVRRLIDAAANRTD